MRIDSIAALDSQGRAVTLSQAEILILREKKISRQPLVLASTILRTRSLTAPYHLLKAWIHSRLARPASPYEMRELRGLYRAKVGFLRERLGLDLSLVEVHAEGMTFRFNFGNDRALWDLMSVLFEVLEANVYGVSRRNMEGKVVVDVGAHLGVFSVLAVRMGAKEVYAFEPVQSTYRLLVANISINGLNDVIHPINSALGETKNTSWISCRFGGDSSASLDPARATTMMGQQCPVVRLDDFGRGCGMKADFIKIDAEGYEQRIIIGAQETIKRTKPCLSIAAYHNREDPEKLLSTILSIRGDYTYQPPASGEMILHLC